MSQQLTIGRFAVNKSGESLTELPPNMKEEKSRLVPWLAKEKLFICTAAVPEYCRFAEAFVRICSEWVWLNLLPSVGKWHLRFACQVTEEEGRRGSLDGSPFGFTFTETKKRGCGESRRRTTFILGVKGAFWSTPQFNRWSWLQMTWNRKWLHGEQRVSVDHRKKKFFRFSWL